MVYRTEEERIIAQEVIEKQLASKEPERLSFLNGKWETDITPVWREEWNDASEDSLSLCGEWRVSYSPFSASEEELVKREVFDDKWEKRNQPGKICIYDTEVCPDRYKDVYGCNGFDRVNMTHFTENDGAIIRKTVRIPESWENKEIILCFEAIYPASRIYLNGELLAEHTSGLTPIYINVTDKVKAGDEVLVAVRILRYHKYIRLDMPRHSSGFAGLAQPARFFAKERCRITGYYLPALFKEDNLKKGLLTGEIYIKNDLDENTTGEIQFTITAPDGTLAKRVNFAAFMEAHSERKLPIKILLPDPLLWNDEHPYLYTVTVTEYFKGQKPESYTFKKGFRHFAIKDCRATLNGNPVKFRGVNHLSYHPEGGIHTPTEWLRKSLELMKKANVNAIRTHYMGPTALSDLCDEMGFYLIQELPVDWGTHFIHDPEWVGQALMRLQSGVLRDRNRTCIHIWAIGNENMPESQAVENDGWMHLQLYNDFVKALSPDKYTMFPPPGPTKGPMLGRFELKVGDIADVHYSFKLAKQFLTEGKVSNPLSWEFNQEITTREEALANGWSGTWFASEYGLFSNNPDILYSPNDCSIIDDEKPVYPEDTTTLKVFHERLKREWGFMRNEPSCLGGTFFPWISGASDSIEGHPFRWSVLSEDNDWGVVTPSLIPKPTFWALRSCLSPIDFPDEVKWDGKEEGFSMELWNQYNDINLNQCTVRVSDLNTSNRWYDIPVDLAPGEKKDVFFPFWRGRHRKELNKGRAIKFRLYFIDPNGFITTTRDIRVFSGGETYEGVATQFDVSASPEHIDTK